MTIIQNNSTLMPFLSSDIQYVTNIHLGTLGHHQLIRNLTDHLPWQHDRCMDRPSASHIPKYRLLLSVLHWAIHTVYCFFRNHLICRQPRVPTPWIYLPINALLAGGFVFFFVMNSLVYSIWRYNINGVLIGLGFGPGSSQVMSTDHTTCSLNC